MLYKIKLGMSLKLDPVKVMVLIFAITFTITVNAQTPAQPNKVLHIALKAPDDGFDMVKTSNYYSGVIAEAIFEPLLGYDYLARPIRLVPKTAQALPKIEQAGKVYIFKIKPGIYFSPDPVFKGKRRELVAQDYIYSIQRVLDPKNRSPVISFIQGKIVGIDRVVSEAQKTGKFNYDVPIAGLIALDRYTLQISLNQPDYNFQYILAYIAFSGSAREAVEYYGDRYAQHPVGTGPYQLSQYVPRSKIELLANPYYVGFLWNFKSTGTAWDNRIVKQMTGKKMPQIGKVVVSVIEEEQSRWLAFQSGQLDIDDLPGNAVPQALKNNHLRPELQKKGIQHFPNKDLEVVYNMMNMRDPIIGGFALDKVALRRAIAMSYNPVEMIQHVYKGQAVKAEMMIPEGISGFNPNYKSSVSYNPKLANKLLDHYGYKKGTDGYRNLPNGKPLTLKFNTENSSLNLIASEVWKKNLDLVGLRVSFKVSNFADNLKESALCQYMIWGGAWIADFPEGENFAQLLYGPNATRGNGSCYQSNAYDAFYRQAMKLPPEQRTPYYEKMNRQVEADNPWIIGLTRTRNWLIQPQVQGFKAHPMLHINWQYLDLQPQAKK